MYILEKITIIKLMNRLSGKTRKGKLIYLVSLLLLGAFLVVLLPYFGTPAPNRDVMYFNYFDYLFGGNVVMQNSGHMYSFSFKINVYLIIYQLVIALAFLGSLFSKNSPKNLLLTFFLTLACLIASFFVAFFIVNINKGFAYKDIHFGYAYYIQVGLLIVAAGLTLILYFNSKRFWKKRFAE